MVLLGWRGCSPGVLLDKMFSLCEIVCGMACTSPGPSIYIICPDLTHLKIDSRGFFQKNTTGHPDDLGSHIRLLLIMEIRLQEKWMRERTQPKGGEGKGGKGGG